MLLLISFVAFVIIEIMPGDFLTALRLNPQISSELLEGLKERYGLDRPWYEQYAIWVKGVIWRFDFGLSFHTQQSAWEELTGSGSLAYSLILFVGTTVISVIIALLYGIYTATRRNAVHVSILESIADVGAAVPPFLLALLVLEVLVSLRLGFSPTGLFDLEYITAPWSLAKFLNFLWHLLPAMLVIGLTNTILLMREIRAHLYDTLNQPYIYVARSKGLDERVVIWKHVVRNALIAPISIFGLWTSYMFGALLVASIVLNLPTMEYKFWLALVRQDQNVVLVGIVFFSFLLLIMNLIADLLLAIADPRIVYYD